MKLWKVLLQLKREEPNLIIVLKTEQNGMFWSGKARFARCAITCDAGEQEVKLIEKRQNAIALTIS